MIEVTDKPIDPAAIFARMSHDGSGSVVVHFGVVKPVVEGKGTAGVKFAPDGDLEVEMREIEKDIRGKYELTDFLLIRRMGALNIGDVIMVAAASAPSRDAAFAACRNAVEESKKLRRIKKEELFKD